MNRLLPTGFLLLATAAAAQAQQADTLAAHLADSAAVVAVVPALRVSDPMQPTVATARNLPGLTTMQSLLSQVAGVQVTPYSGAPGAWAAVRIRGVNSVTSPSQPLYVVDDVPVYNTDPTPEAWASMRNFFTSPAFRAETPFTSGGNPLLDLPVEDVATVEVLQDAAATARYGLQGGNGVVRITTRRGAAGQPGPQPVRVRYAGYVGVQQVRQRYAVLDGPQFAALANQAWTNSGRTGLLYDAEEVRSRGSVNWQDELFRTGISTGHNLSLDGNTRTTRYYVAADYLNQNGVLKGSSLTRYSLRANVDQQVTARGSLGLKVAGSQIDQRYPGFDPDAGGLLQNALQEVPLGTRRDAQGLPFTSDPVQTAGAVRGTPHTRRLLAQLSATYQLRPDLTLRVLGSREETTARQDTYADFPPLSGISMFRRTESEKGLATATSWVGQAILRYQRTLAERHALTASAEYLLQKFSQKLADSLETTTTFSQGFPGSPVSATGVSRAFISTEFKLLHPIQSPTVAVGYVYDGRYEVQASLRADHLNNDRPTRDTTFWYPGAQVRWHLGHEQFMAGVAGLDELVLHVGMGRTSASLFSLAQSSGLDRSTQVDAGVQAAWLDRRLTASATVYQRRTQHIPGTFAFPISMGGTFYYFTDFELRNRGLELTLSSAWQRGPVRGSTTLAAAAAFNRVEEIAALRFFSNQRTVVPTIETTTLETGQPLGQHRVYDSTLSPTGAPQTSPGPGETYGTGLPRYTLNLTQQLSYRRFQLDAQVDGLFGYQILNPTLLALDTPNGRGNNSVEVLNYWMPGNQSTRIPRPSADLRTLPATRQNLTSGDHLRLTQLVVSYALLNTAARKVSVWVGGQNLLVTGRYRGYDPNVNSRGGAPFVAGIDAANYPVARAWQLGVRGQF